MNRKYTSTKKNKGIVPEVKDKRVLYVPVSCGKCIECRKKKAREWQTRLSEELRHRKDGYFVTLTFSDESLIKLGEDIKGLSGYDFDNEIATKAVRRFCERWRKKYGKSIRHWFVTELGQTKTERIHIHGLVWTDEDKIKTLEERWSYGNIWIGQYVSEKTVNYIVKYLSKTDSLHPEYVSKMLTSAGIGKGYLDRKDSKNNKFKDIDTNEGYSYRNGTKGGLPIYYRNHLYNDEEREQLWLQKLDKEERYVLGKKIDVSNGDDVYYKVLEEARRKNKRLGYGDDSVNWEKRKYENDRRNMLKKERLKKKG